MKVRVAAAGSVLAAVLASSCCWGPLVLAGLGAGFVAGLAPYRSYFSGVTFLFLTGAWYFTLRRHPAVASAPPPETSAVGGCGSVQEAQGACCAPTGAGRSSILLLSGITAFALAMLAYPQISSIVAASSGVPAGREPAGPVETTTLAVKGITCEACAVRLRQALLKVPGVVAAQVSARTGSARVTSRQGRISPEQLKQVVAITGYMVSAAAATTLPARVSGAACCAPGAGK